MVSVCLPTYNGSTYIIDQVTSILDQLSFDDELIISDDKSTDNTIDLILGLKDNRIKIFRHENPSSYIFNYENAIKNSKGDIIFLSDQDDVWLPNKLKTMLGKLGNVDLVLSDCYVTDSKLNIVSKSYFSIRKTKKNKYISLLGGSPYLGCCMAFKRIILNRVLPFPSYIPSHDTWIGNIAAFYYKIEIIESPLIYYRRHEGNISMFAGQSSTSLIDKIKSRLKIIIALVSKI